MKAKRFLSVLFVLVLVMSFIMPGFAFAEGSITLSDVELELEVDDSWTLSFNAAFEYDEYSDVSWASDNEDVATVDDWGEVCALSAGVAIITVTIKDESASCTVTVTGGTPVAVCGEDALAFDSLSGAVNSAKYGDTVTLLCDITLAETVEVKRNLSLDLNGYTLSCGEGMSGAALRVSKGTLTIDNGSVCANSPDCACIEVTGNGRLVILGGRYSNPAGEVIINNGADDAVSINGGTIEGAEPISAAPEFRFNSLLLSGQIDVNFYMDLPEAETLDYSNSYMDFTVNGNTQRDYYDSAHTDPEGKGCYGFTCFINSVQMADEISAVFHYEDAGEEKTIEKTYSAKEYIDYVAANGGYSDKAVKLIKAIADYGHYVQPFLAQYNGWTLGTDHKEMSYFNEYTNEDVQSARTATSDKHFTIDRADTSGIVSTNYSLSLDTETAINLYLSVSDGCVIKEATASGVKTLNVQKLDGSVYRIVIPGITAPELGKEYVVTITEEFNGVTAQDTISVSALAYVQSVLTSERDDFKNDTVRNAVTALYRYWAAATEYNK